MSARTCASVKQQQPFLQECAPGLANARVPPAAIAGGHRDREIAAAFRHAAEEADFAS